MSYKKQELLTLREHLSSLPFFSGLLILIFLVLCDVLVCVFSFLVPYCPVRYDFHITTMFGSSLHPVVCRRAHVVLCCLCLFACSSLTFCPVLCLYVLSSLLHCTPLRKPQTRIKSLTALSHNVVSSALCLNGIQTHNVNGERH